LVKLTVVKIAWQLNCPPIRLCLGPGEGFRLPPGGLILDGDATDKREPDVLLLISEQPLAQGGSRAYPCPRGG